MGDSGDTTAMGRFDVRADESDPTRVIVSFRGSDKEQSMTFDEAAEMAALVMAVLHTAAETDEEAARLFELFKAKWKETVGEIVSRMNQAAKQPD